MKIGSISTFLTELAKIERTRDRLIFFRGHPKKSYAPLPSVFRNPGLIDNETTMLKELILRCPNDFTGDQSTFECLVKMQHYGLPTRLLDVTSNPLVALHFACQTQDKDDDDGQVLIFSSKLSEVKYFDSDTVSVISNISRRPIDFVVPSYPPSPTKDDIEKFNKENDIPLLLHDIRQDKPHFEPIINPIDLERVICVKPKLDNPRLIRQEGAFLLFGCNGVKNKPANFSTEIIVSKITINRDKKRELSDDLETLGISDATLFPEIERVASHIKRSYETPRIDLRDLTELQIKVLGTFREDQTRSTKNVAADLNISAQSAGSILARLYEKRVLDRDGHGRKR